MRESDEAGKDADQYVFYIHDMRTFAEDASSPQLVVTKYSFLADHRAFTVEGVARPNQELVLHFQDADRMAAESDAQLINIDKIVTVDTLEPPSTVVHVSQAPGRAIHRYFTRHTQRKLTSFC